MPRSPLHAATVPLGIAAATAGLVFAACKGEGPFAALLPHPTQLEITIQPNGARIGSPLGVQPIVEVHDALGRVVKDRVPVAVALASGDGHLLGTVVANAVDGVARFTDLRLMGGYGAKTLTFTAPGLPSVTADSVDLSPAVRSSIDRPDDIPGSQVHVVYVLPRGSKDRELDTRVDIANSVAAFQRWLARATRMQIRFDLYQGDLDVSFFELSRPDSEMRLFGSFVVSEIERELAGAGVIQPDKRYLIYYDGSAAALVCGGAAWPPTIGGQVAAIYLRNCPAELASRPNDSPGYWEFAALHDLLHTLGIVSSAAPHHTANSWGHVPEPEDLMYGGGTSPWEPTTVDVNGDDYFAPNLPDGLSNLATNVFMEPVAATIVAASAPVGGHPLISSILPAHPPFVKP